MRAGWHEATNILCVRLDSVGDVLMTTPALRALGESRPDRRLTLLTSEAGAQAARLVPELDEIIVFKAPWMKAALGTPSADRALVATLAGARFDAAVIFTVYSQSPLPAAYLCYLAGVPLRLAHCRENPYQLLTDWVPEREPQELVRHEVRRQLDLVATIGCAPAHERLSFAVPIAARRQVKRLLKTAEIRRDRPLVALHPGATAAARRYPPERFARVVATLVERHGCEVVLTGDAAEAPLIEEIRSAAQVRSHSFAGRLDLAELGALIAAADVLVSNNTGPVHVAAALGTPVVDIYALTNPQHTPWRVERRVLYHDVPCRYCYKSVCPTGRHECLQAIAPQEVVAATVELLEGLPGQAPEHELPAPASPQNPVPILDAL